MGASSPIPFTIGTKTFGFDQKNMDKLCLQPGGELYNSSKVKDCQQKGAKFREIQMQTARFVAAQQRLNAAKIAFQSEVTKSSKEFAAAMESTGSEIVNDAP